MNPRAAAIIIENRRVLLVHRIKSQRDYWVLPGGSIEGNESVEQACLREVKEETGLDIQILSRVLTMMNKGRGEIYFLARPIGGKLALGGPEKSRQSASNRYFLRWMRADDLTEIDLQPKEIKAVIAEQIEVADDASWRH
jgi:8-oxo-dGTP diphosphatase